MGRSESKFHITINTVSQGITISKTTSKTTTRSDTQTNTATLTKKDKAGYYTWEARINFDKYRLDVYKKNSSGKYNLFNGYSVKENILLPIMYGRKKIDWELYFNII